MNTQLKLKLFSLAESLGDIGHWWIETQTHKLYWSDQTYIIHGVDKETFMPTVDSAIQLYHPDDSECVRQNVNSAMQSGRDFSFTLRIIQPTGDICHVQCKAQCEKDEAGIVTHIFGIFRDVTQETEAKETALRTQYAHRTLIESSTDGFWDWYVQTDYQYMSPRFWEMFGYLPEEKPNKPSAWQEIIFPEDLEIALVNFQKHVDTRGIHPYIQEVRYRHKNGSTVTVLCRGKVIDWDKNGKPIRMIGTHTDITTMQTAQEQLRKNLHFQQLLININTDLIFVKDIQFRIVSANEAFLSLYPKSMRDSVIGSTTIEKYSKQEAELFLKEDRIAFVEGKSEVIETVLFPDGKKRTMQTTKTRFIDVDKSPMILCVARDITDLKKIESDLIGANNELEEFAYRTSHDLRSPLISTQRLLTFINRDFNKNKHDHIPQNIALAKDTLKKLEYLVSDILTLSRLQNNEPILSDINFEDVIQSTLSNIKNMEGFDKIALSQTINTPKTLSLEKENIQQIIQNLVSNSVKYQDASQPQPKINLSVASTSSKVTIIVSDNGLGIPEKSRDKLFCMFKRFHNNVSYGSGLGLYMLKKNIQKMGGVIEYSPLSNGSKFTVTLPINAKKDNTHG